MTEPKKADLIYNMLLLRKEDFDDLLDQDAQPRASLPLC